MLMKRKDTQLIVENWRNLLQSDIDLSYNIKSEEFRKKLYEGDILEEGFLGKVMDWVQVGFDIAGLIPGLGEGFDAINAVISLSRGRPLEALCSIISLFPGIGDAIGKTGKLLLHILGPHIDDIISGKLTSPSELKTATNESFMIYETNQEAKKKLFLKGVEVFTKNKDKWFPLVDKILTFAEGRGEEKDAAEAFEKSGIKISPIPDNLKEKIGKVIKNKIKNPEIIRKQIENLMVFFDNCIKEKGI